MNATITLFIYWSIASGLIGGGIFALIKGFQLVLGGKGKSKEASTIDIFGVKASVNSIGALVMVVGSGKPRTQIPPTIEQSFRKSSNSHSAEPRTLFAT